MTSPQTETRVALFVFEADDDALLAETLERIPSEARDVLCEIVVMRDDPATAGAAPEALGKVPVLHHRSPRRAGYGGARKAAFEYALVQGIDVAIHLRAGVHPPERIPELVAAILDDPGRIAIGSRWAQWRSALGWRTAPRLLLHGLWTVVQNRLLGLRLLDYHTGFRAVPLRALRHVPFQLNSDGRSFDMELVIQCRVLGLPVHEVPVGPPWHEYPEGHTLRAAFQGFGTGLDYRAHQLHLTRRGRYLVDTGVHYTLKHAPTSSHSQIVDAIRPESRVLDLGCSQGLLARPLAERGVRVTGVDLGPPDAVAHELEAYYPGDLELPLELPTGRAFDYVVVSDVIEHVRNRTQLLRSARRYLKEGGRLIISTPNIALWFYRLSLLVGRFEYGPRGVLDRTHVHLFTRATFRREVERAGFAVLDERVTALPFEVVFESTGRSRLVRGLASFYHRLARLWPELFAYQFILEAAITTLDEESTAP